MYIIFQSVEHIAVITGHKVDAVSKVITALNWYGLYSDQILILEISNFTTQCYTTANLVHVDTG